MTRTPEYLNLDTEELNETRFHLMMTFEDNLFRILVDTGATHSYVVEELLEKILSSNYSIFKPISQMVIPIRISKAVNHVSFRLVPELKSTSILVTNMIKSLKITLNQNIETWWLPGSPPTRYHMETMPNSLFKSISEGPIQNLKKGSITSNQDSKKINANKINSNIKIQNSANSRFKSGTEGIENNNKELKTKFEGKIKSKSGRENFKTLLERNLNDFIQTDDDSDLSQKARNAQIAKANPCDNTPSLFNIPTKDTFQVLKNPTPKTQDINAKPEIVSQGNGRIKNLAQWARI